MTIDQLIAAHWGDCDVMEGETPEAYTIRHEEPVQVRGGGMMLCGITDQARRSRLVWVRYTHEGTVEVLDE